MALTIYQNIPIDPNDQAYKQGQLGTCLCSSQINATTGKTYSKQRK
jgi:hypothetical protein